MINYEPDRVERIRGTLTTWAILTVGISLAAWLFGGITVNGGFWGYVWVAAILGLVNTLVKPFVILFTLPLTILTLGAFLLVVNAISLVIVTKLTSLIEIDRFSTSFWAAIVISLVSWFLNGTRSDMRGGRRL